MQFFILFIFFQGYFQLMKSTLNDGFGFQSLVCNFFQRYFQAMASTIRVYLVGKIEKWEDYGFKNWTGQASSTGNRVLLWLENPQNQPKSVKNRVKLEIEGKNGFASDPVFKTMRRIKNREGMEKWEDRKHFNFPLLCLVGSGKSELV